MPALIFAVIASLASSGAAKSVRADSTATAVDAPAIRLPPNTRRDPAGHYIAGRGLRDSTDFIAKELARKGIAARQIGPTRVRGVEISRFLIDTPSTTFLAIHVLRQSGKTLIFFVPRSKPTK